MTKKKDNLPTPTKAGYLVELSPFELSKEAYYFYRVSMIQIYKYGFDSYSYRFQGTLKRSRQMSLEDLNETLEAFYYIYL